MNNIDQTEQLLRQLIESFTYYPRDLHIEPKGVSALIDFVVECHELDQKLCIGHKGSHIKALALITALMGKADEATYRFVLVDRVIQPTERSEPKLADRYDAEPARVLLLELLKYVFDETPKIEVSAILQQKPLSYTFGIRCATAKDLAMLTERSRSDVMTLEAALGTLFRAWANKDGVAFKIETP